MCGFEFRSKTAFTEPGEKEGVENMKKLYRSKDDRKLFGVCGGLGQYFNLDATIVRLIFVILGLMHVGVLFYILAALIIPEEPY